MQATVNAPSASHACELGCVAGHSQAAGAHSSRADASWLPVATVWTTQEYYLGPQDRAGLLFGFGAIDEAGIAAGLKALRKVW